jgi:PAS domain S-box-containing protein
MQAPLSSPPDLGKPEHGASRIPASVDLPPILDVLEYTTDCVVLLDANWRFQYLNRNAQAVLATGRNLLGAELHEVFASEKGTEEWKLTQSAAKERKSTQFEFFASHLKVWFEVHIHPIPSGLQIYFRDVTARRDAEAALAKREGALRLALEAVGDAAWDWDLKAEQISISGWHVKSLGYGPTRFDGSIRKLNALIHPDDLREMTKELNKHLAGRSKRYCCEFRMRAISGEWRWCTTRGRVIERDPVTGWATRMVGTSIDMSRLAAADRKQAKA